MIQIKDTSIRKINIICDEHYDNIKRPIITAIKKNIDKKRRDYLIDRLEDIIKGTPSELLNTLKNYNF